MQRTIILYLFLLSILATFGQDSSYKLMTVGGKTIGDNIYRYMKYDEINQIGKGVLNGQEVFLDTLGNVVLTSPYENMIWRRVYNAPGVHHLYGARGGRWAVLNSRLEPVTGFDYEKIEEVHAEIAKVRKNGLWGAVDILGNQIVSCLYTYFDEFKGNFAMVHDKGLSGVIYKDGKLVVSATNKLNDIYPLHAKDNGLIAVQLDWKWGIVNSTGKTVLPPIYSQIYGTDNPEAPFSIIIDKDSYWGLIDRMGQIVITPDYDKIDIFPQGAIAYNREKDMYSFFNSKGELKLTSKTEIDITKNGLETQNDSVIFDYNYEGKIIRTLSKDDAYHAQGDFRDWRTRLWGYSRNRKMIIPCIYDLLNSIDDSHFEVKKNGKYGIIDINNKITLPIKYDYIDILTYNRCKLEKNNKYALSDWNGKQLTPFSYDHIKSTPFDSTLFKVYKYKDNKWGIRNIDGEQVVPDIYTYKDLEDSMIGSNDYLGYGYYLVKRNGKYGILNAKTSKEEIPCEYYYYNKVGSNLVTTRENDKLGAIVATAQGLKIIPCIYDNITVLRNGAITAQKDGKWGVIDENNNAVIPFENKIIEQYYKDILIVGK